MEKEIMKCEDCPYLIKRYGYCVGAGKYVCEPTDSLSFDINGKIPRK